MRAVLLALILAAAPAAASARCALALILALDVSGSVDAREWRLQSEGLAAAFRDPALIEAVLDLEGDLAVAVTQWTGASRQGVALVWRRLSAPADIAAFADALERMPRMWRHHSTAIGEALDHAVAFGRVAPEGCRRQVVDISGDGVSNEGGPPSEARLRALASGWTVNGLVIEGAAPPPLPHYREEVVIGPGAFVEVAASYDDFAPAMLRKLLREIRADARVSSLR